VQIAEHREEFQRLPGEGRVALALRLRGGTLRSVAALGHELIEFGLVLGVT
jgi:hypothetical protein